MSDSLNAETRTESTEERDWRRSRGVTLVGRELQDQTKVSSLVGRVDSFKYWLSHLLPRAILFSFLSWPLVAPTVLYPPWCCVSSAFLTNILMGSLPFGVAVAFLGRQSMKKLEVVFGLVCIIVGSSAIPCFFIEKEEFFTERLIAIYVVLVVWVFIIVHHLTMNVGRKRRDVTFDDVIVIEKPKDDTEHVAMPSLMPSDDERERIEDGLVRTSSPNGPIATLVTWSVIYIPLGIAMAVYDFVLIEAFLSSNDLMKGVIRIVIHPAVFLISLKLARFFTSRYSVDHVPGMRSILLLPGMITCSIFGRGLIYGMKSIAGSSVVILIQGITEILWRLFMPYRDRFVFGILLRRPQNELNEQANFYAATYIFQHEIELICLLRTAAVMSSYNFFYGVGDLDLILLDLGIQFAVEIVVFWTVALLSKMPIRTALIYRNERRCAISLFFVCCCVSLFLDTRLLWIVSGRKPEL